MSSVQLSSPSTGHTIHPSAYRASVLGRRVNVSPSVAAVMVSIAFGEPRDHVGNLPASIMRSR